MDQLRSPSWGIKQRHDPWPIHNMHLCPVYRSDDKKEPALQETSWRTRQFVQLGHEGASSVDFRDSSMFHLSANIYKLMGRPQKSTTQPSLQGTFLGTLVDDSHTYCVFGFTVDPTFQRPLSATIWVGWGFWIEAIPAQYGISPGSNLCVGLTSVWPKLAQNCTVVWGSFYPISLPSLLSLASCQTCVTVWNLSQPSVSFLCVILHRCFH